MFSPLELQELAAKRNLPYFGTVSETGIKELYVYDKPIVALASKFPIISLESVKVKESVLDDLNIKPSFSFSRPPLKAELFVEGFGKLLVYVVHLKSHHMLYIKQHLDTMENCHLLITEYHNCDRQGNHELMSHLMLDRNLTISK